LTIPDHTAPSKVRRFVQLILVLIVIGAGVAAAAYFKSTATKTRRRPPEILAPLVETMALQEGSYAVTITAMGVVVPAEEMTLKARVGGQVLGMHPEFTVGGLLKAGQELLQVDDSDYRLAVAQAQSAVVNSEYALSLEKGRQAVARREWALLNGKAKGVDADLALRKPHLAKAEADLMASQAALDEARLELARTRVTAPFNAMVRSRLVAPGSQIGTQEALAELVGTDRFWVEVSVPVDRLDWLRIPRLTDKTGATATIHYAQKHRRQGQVVRLRGDLATEGRMARVLVAVEDPLGLKAAEKRRPPLLISEFVRVEIEGRRLEGVYSLPRSAVHDGDTIWLASAENTLSIRGIRPVWRDADTVVVDVVSGLKPGERLVTTALPAPVEGMPLRTDADAPPAKGPAKGGDKAKGGKSS
jgi:RND family efflux transporter MFP subunit